MVCSWYDHISCFNHALPISATVSSKALRLFAKAVFRINSLVTSKAGVYAVIPTSLLTLLFLAFYHHRLTLHPISIWQPSPDCLDFPSNYTQIEYYWLATDFSGNLSNGIIEVLINVEGILFKFIPSIILLAVTLLLVFELRKLKIVKLTTKNKRDTKRTSKLVLFVTFTFIIAIIPQGVLYTIMLSVQEGTIIR